MNFISCRIKKKILCVKCFLPFSMSMFMYFKVCYTILENIDLTLYFVNGCFCKITISRKIIYKQNNPLHKFMLPCYCKKLVVLPCIGGGTPCMRLLSVFRPDPLIIALVCPSHHSTAPLLYCCSAVLLYCCTAVLL